MSVAALAFAQTWTPGPQVVTFLSAVDDTDQPYALYVPHNYTPEKRWPLVISLHGVYSNHRLNLRRVLGQGNRPGESDAQASRYFPPPPQLDMIVASPLARGTMGYQGLAERDVYDVLEDVKKRFSIDEDRIYLTGLSMGGGGALWLGLTRPDIWAAIAAVCPAAMEETKALAGNALNVPVKLFQGALDPVVPPAGTREWQERFREAGVNADYVEFRGVRHNAWDYAYKDGAIFDWFRQFRLQRKPERVKFSSRSYRHGAAYWVRFDKLTPGTLATVDARLSGARVTVRTEALDAFSLTLAERIDGVEIDGKALRIRPKSRLSFRRTAAGWVQGSGAPGPGEKAPGREGPIAQAFADRHIYVHGPNTRAVATEAANWSLRNYPLLLSFRILSERELSPADAAGSNLILFGTKETNGVIANYADQLPLHLNPGAADYGVVYIYPVAGRYVVLASGLPWWTRLDQTKRGEWSFMGAPYRALAAAGDYLIFRGGLDNVIAEGRFDNNWRFPPEVAAKLRETGAMEVRDK